MMATTRGRCSTTSATGTSSIRSGTPKWRRTASRIFGANWRRQARDRLPLDQLRALRLGLHRRLEVLDHGLKLLVRQLFERVPVLDLMLARKHHRNHLEVHSRILLAHPRDGLFSVLVEIPEQRANHRLAQPVTRATQASGRVQKPIYIMPNGFDEQAMAWVNNMAHGNPNLHPVIVKNGGTAGFGTVIVNNPSKDLALFIAVN